MERKASKMFLMTAIFLLMGTSCTSQPKVQGEWYGLRDKSLMVVTFDEDQVNVKSEAFSSLSFSGKYKLDKNTNPMLIDLTECSNGMAGVGVLQLNNDGTMEMNCSFGAPGMVQRPQGINPQPENMAEIYLKLTRDKAGVLAEITPTTRIPAEAKLAFERNQRLGAGINLNAVVDGNLHPGFERDAPLDDKEIQSIAEVGFNSVRLDVCWVKHCQKVKPWTIDEAFFRKVDHIVDECLKNGLAVSIDQHYYPYINMGEDADTISKEANFERLTVLWDQIANHYKDYPDDMLFFDLLNEPNLQMGADKWNEVYRGLIKTIRKTNPNRTLIVATPNLGQSWTLGLLDLPEDDWNLIVEFHYYLPHLFTHQGLAYAQAEGSTYVEWKGTEAEKAMIESDLDFCKRWSDSYGRPLNMGEYGCMNTADLDSRCRYIGFMREASEKRGFSSHLWGYREPFMIRAPKTGEWEMSIVEAMKLNGSGR